MNMPAVSAVIATYWAGEYLRHAIGSALAQTYVDLEVIVSDDADDPGVRELAESFDDSRIRYRSKPKSPGSGRKPLGRDVDRPGAVRCHSEPRRPLAA